MHRCRHVFSSLLASLWCACGGAPSTPATPASPNADTQKTVAATDDKDPKTASAQIDPYASAPTSAPAEAKPDPAAAYRTGLQQYARGDYAGALATLRTSADANPGYALTWRGLGLVHEKLGNKG